MLLNQPNMTGRSMAIRKQEFYEGAALHLLARTGQVRSLRYEPPFFFINDENCALLKYSTRSRSPWSFTFTGDEQFELERQAGIQRVLIGLICGSDGVVALNFSDYLTIAIRRPSSVHVSCFRQHNQHYEVNGPDGTLGKKIAPSSWRRILEVQAVNL